MQKRKDTKPTAPAVGIVFLVGNKNFLDSTSLSGAGRYADYLIHERSHIKYWAELVKSGKVPD